MNDILKQADRYLKASDEYNKYCNYLRKKWNKKPVQETKEN